MSDVENEKPAVPSEAQDVEAPEVKEVEETKDEEAKDVKDVEEAAEEGEEAGDKIQKTTDVKESENITKKEEENISKNDEDKINEEASEQEKPAGDENETEEGEEGEEGEDKEKVVFKSGDWYCQGCGVHNFAKRAQCMSCGHMKLAHPTPGKDTSEWECPSCRSINPSRRVNCRHCLFNPMLAKQFMTHPLQYTRGGAAAMSQHSYSHVHYPQMPHAYGSGPGFGQPRSYSPYADSFRHSSHGMGFMGSSAGWGAGPSTPADSYYGFDYYQQMKHAGGPQDPMADWDCWVCGHLNYAKRMQCKTCETEKDKALPRSGGGTPRPGDWFCMACQNVNFSRRQECKMCTAPRTTSSNEIVLQRLRGFGL
eukprot:TRINITY_DN5522_c0_g2_i1.p1 TRINITY_DN5522_c0_g2~~TRINITY_DN5522_c0_g2_i1.p1  ORF type:complete len:367 (+),score=75.99 TRINITY_DN5522_c0_g2_i1:911-2011(+)